MTKLDAVQEILRRSGLYVPPALDTDGASAAANAERVLDAEELAVQSRGWHYNTRRKVQLSPDLFEFDNATWDEGGLSLTQSGAFASAVAGQTVTITGGANATTGDYEVASVGSADTITLTSSIGASATTGITGQAANNRIELPAGVIIIDSDWTDACRDLTQRGGAVLDLDDNTQLFDGDLFVTYVERLEFGCIPYPVRRYIMLRAAWEFNAAYGDPSRRAAIGRAVQEARAAALRFNGRTGNYNMLDGASSFLARGQRSRYPQGYIP